MRGAASAARGFASIGLYNPKTNENVGSVLRAATCYGAAGVIIKGRRYTRANTDTTQAWRHMPLQHVDDLMAAAPFGAVPVAVEFIPSATPLPRFTHPESAYYLFGPEDGSLPAELVARCKHVVYVPTEFCMNLSAAANVLLYDRLVKRGAANQALYRA